MTDLVIDELKTVDNNDNNNKKLNGPIDLHSCYEKLQNILVEHPTLNTINLVTGIYAY